MKTSPRFTLRLPSLLLRAAASKANGRGLTLSDWIRRLVEAETGVSAGDMRRGLARRSPQKRRRDARKAARARHAPPSAE